MRSAVHRPVTELGDGEAAAVDRDRVAEHGALEHGGGRDGEPDRVALVGDLGDGAELLDDSGEHQLLLWSWVGAHGESYVGVLAVVAPEDRHVGHVQVEGVGDGADPEVGDGARAGAEQHRGDVRDDLVDEAGPRKARASVGPPSRKTCWRSRAKRLASASCGSRVCRCTVSARSLKIAPVGREVAQSHDRTQRLHGDRLVDLVTDRELGVVDLDGGGADEHRVAEAAQAVGVEARRPAGHPAAGAVGGGAAAVEGRGELPGDEGPLVLDREGPGPVDRARLVGSSRRPRPRRRPRAGGRAPPAATGLGSDWAKTTRRTPAAISASVHGPVRPVWLQGSRVTTAVAPRAASPASVNAATSACGVPAPRWKPSAISSRPGRAARSRRAGWGRAAHPAWRRAPGRAACAALCLAGGHLPLRSGWRGLQGGGDGARPRRRGRCSETLRVLLIRTLTVGPGIPPGQPATGCAERVRCSRRSRGALL